MLIQEKIKNTLVQILKEKYDLDFNIEEIKIERPKNIGYGDLCSTISLNIAKKLKQSPVKIAETLKEELQNKFTKDEMEVELANAGFMNFRLSTDSFSKNIQNLLENTLVEKTNKPENILLEYVSANPTGDLHLGHGRGAVVGSSLASLLKSVGHDVKTEFYLNDAGEQMKKLGRSAWKYYSKIAGDNEDEYPESLIAPYLENLPENLSQEELTKQVKARIIEKQKKVLARCKVEFDNWTSEKEEIHNKGYLDKVIDKLKSKNLIYEEEGAIWLKSTELDDDRNRVLFKSDNKQPTYLMGDIAYHLYKAEKAEKLLNIWGADHCGQDVSLKTALRAIDIDDNRLDFLFLQLVSLMKDKQEVRMSKRTGSLITVEEVLDEVGPDAFRATMLTSHVNNRLVFDIDVLKQSSEQNPVFYLQYAHARASSILRRAVNPDVITNELFCTQEELDNKLKNSKDIIKAFSSELSEGELLATKELVLLISVFNENIQYAAKALNPSHVLNYLLDIAKSFHSFYNVPCKVIDDENRDLSFARLAIVRAVQKAIKTGLDILLIHAPESM